MNKKGYVIDSYGGYGDFLIPGIMLTCVILTIISFFINKKLFKIALFIILLWAVFGVLIIIISRWKK
jgi:hypothetical protein